MLYSKYLVAFFFAELAIRGVVIKKFGCVFFLPNWQLGVLCSKYLVALFFAELAIRGLGN